MDGPTLSLVVIRSGDLDRAARFYAALGITLGRERHGAGPEHLAGAVGGAVFEVYPAGEGQAGATAGVRLGFRVRSVADTVAAAVGAGGRLIQRPKAGAWGLRAVVADPDGHRVEVVEAADDPVG